MNRLTRTLLVCIILLMSCKKDEASVTSYPSNITGEYFKNIISSNNVKIIVVVDSRSGTADYELFYNKHSFAGNNFIRVWNEYPPSTNIYSEITYNLERVAWYKIDLREYDKEDVMALYIEFEPY